jgi:broad specificity phosphatase PhoE
MSDDQPQHRRQRPTRLILVRHGESAGNTDKDLYALIPDHALELTAKGRSQAQQAGSSIAELIQPEPGVATSVRFYVSTHKRTQQTYEEIAAVVRKRDGINWQPTYFDPRLREQDWGHLRTADATAKLEEERDRYGSFHYRFPNGDSCADVYDRISLVLDTMHRDWEVCVPDNVVVVTHGMTMRVFLMRWFKWKTEDFELLRNPPNCGIMVLLQRPDGKFDLQTPLDRDPARSVHD